MGVIGKRPSWNDEFYVKAYRLAREGMADKNIAKTLGVKWDTLTRWKAENKAFASALEQGREKQSKGTRAFFDYIKTRMPEELKEDWDRLTGTDPDKRESALMSVAASTQKAKQSFFVHAYVACNFNTRAACRLVGISPLSVAHWKKSNPRFKHMMATVHEAKKDFFEDALLDLVANRDTSATIFANRTVNRDRGYDTKVTVRFEGEVDHKHSISIKELSPETKRAMLAEIRAKSQAALPDNSKVIDAEFSKKE